MNFAQQLYELSNQMATAYSVLSEAVARGYFDEAATDDDEVRDLKATAHDWVRAFELGSAMDACAAKPTEVET